MFNFYSKSNIREKIKELKFVAKKSFGQNFLVDQNVCEKIVDTASERFNDGVIEIGPGLGVLTNSLSKKFNKVVSIEIDYKLFCFLSNIFKDNEKIKLIHADALEVNLEKLILENFQSSENIVMCSNLPYCITTPILMKFLKCERIKQITVMIQKEAAERILSLPGTKNCGAISSVVRFYSYPRFNFNVSKNCFIPSPKIESSVISFDIVKNYKVSSEKMFFKIIKSAFCKRRKNILNSLSSGLKIEKAKIIKAINLCELNKNLRAENLMIEDYIKLSELISNITKE